jgi:hypothetical protein
MSFEIIRESKPSSSHGAVIGIAALSVLLAGLAVAYAWLLISGRGGDYLMGSILAIEFLIAGLEVLLYGRFFVSFREVSEDREEELLW